MDIEVEGPEEFGTSSYEVLFKSIVQDLGIYRSVERARIIVRPDVPFFLISVRMRSRGGLVQMGDVVDLKEVPEGARITINDENYAPAILKMLWDDYGRDRIDQLSRLEIVAKDIKPEDLKGRVLDSSQKQRTQLLDAMWRLLPEGFKVRHNLMSENIITLMTTEAIMESEWIGLAESVHKEMEEYV